MLPPGSAIAHSREHGWRSIQNDQYFSRRDTQRRNLRTRPGEHHQKDNDHRKEYRQQAPEMLIAEISELRLVIREEGWRDGDLTTDIRFRIHEYQFALENRLYFLVTRNMDDEYIVTEVPKDLQSILNASRIHEIRNHNGQAAAP